MQEEIENRSVNLAITTTKLTARALLAGFKKFEESRSRHKAVRAARKEAKRSRKPEGRQTVKQLIGQGKDITSMDIEKTDLRGFQKYARMYGIDYAITKDKSGDVPRYICFFKAENRDVMTAAFRAWSAEAERKETGHSVLKYLARMKALVRTLPQKTRTKEKERTLER